jgi:hypothetical protein
LSVDHTIQKQLICHRAKETTKIVMRELGYECFDILGDDESSDAYQHEQWAISNNFIFI